MPTSRLPSPGRSSRTPQLRARYARTNADLLVNEPDGFPSAFPPVWWIGLDSGGGRWPIGPNGPSDVYGFGYGYGPALPVVVRATALITGPLASSPFKQVDTTTGQELPLDRWLADPMLLRPDARVIDSPYPMVRRLARSLFWVEWIRSAIWWGEGPFIYTPDASGSPLAGTLRLIDPRLLDTEYDDQGRLCWVIGTDDTSARRAVFDAEGYLQLGPVTYRLCVLRNPHSPVDIYGRSMGVFEMTPQAFGIERQVEAYTSGTFRSGVPAGYLKVKQEGLVQEAADELRENWMRHHGGDRRSIAVLNAVTDFMPLNLSPIDAALGEVKRLSIADVAFAFGLDPMTFGAGLNNSATYANLRDAWENHRDFGLALWIAGVQDTLSALEPATVAVEVDMDEFGSPTLKDQYDAAKTGIDAGLFTADEWRADRGLPPLSGQTTTPEPALPVTEDDQAVTLPGGRRLQIAPRST